MNRKLILPHRNGNNTPEEIELIDSLVIVGANGSGKSRLGSYIQTQNRTTPVKRISAQRMLTFSNTQPKNFTDAVNGLISSTMHVQVYDSVNDYDLVISTLFAQTTKRDEEYVAASKADSSKERLPIPESSIDKLQRIWNDILPHRQIYFEEGKIAGKYGAVSYPGLLMSDGEKVCLYLLAQCLVLPKDCLIIIDEPELHVHKALITKVWNQLEQERPDCLFVYITHDLDFAASRVKSKKIWVKEYKDDNKWEWEDIPDEDSIPENLLLEIVGSRKPILFVEGEKGSYDHALYQYVYSDFTIIPRGGCSQVITSVKGMRNNNELHSIQAFGLIDRDYRSNEEIAALLEQGIYVLDFSEVENILMISDLVKLVAKNQALDEEVTLSEVKESAFTLLETDLEKIVSYKTSLDVSYLLNTFDRKKLGAQEINESLISLTSSINVADIYSENEKLFKDILQTKNYNKLLKFYNNKGLLPQVSPKLKLSSKEYPNLILRLLSLEDRQGDIIAALKNELPEISFE